MLRFGVAHSLLHALDFILNVSVGDKNVGPAVVIVVEEKAAEAQGDKSGAADLRPRGLVHEQAVALIVVEREHLVGEVGDDDAGMAGAVVVAGINPHAGTRHAVFTEGDSRRDRPLLKCAILLVQIKLVGLSVVGE